LSEIRSSIETLNLIANFGLLRIDRITFDLIATEAIRPVWPPVAKNRSAIRKYVRDEKTVEQN
jgi:hypothetical protein